MKNPSYDLQTQYNGNPAQVEVVTRIPAAAGARGLYQNRGLAKAIGELAKATKTAENPNFGK